MASLNETPSGSRIHIAFFGRRNAGKSTLVNAFTGQEIAIVSDVAGTTTDPVSKAMEILPLGPCLITDTAGLDDEGTLGEERVRRSLEVLEKTDIAVWVAAGCTPDPAEEDFRKTCTARNVPVFVYRRGDSVEKLKAAIAEVRLVDEPRPLVADLVSSGDTVVCVCPIDESAPKGRLILPQQQVIRELLDAGASALVCQPAALAGFFSRVTRPAEQSPNRTIEQSNNPPIEQSPNLLPRFVITDSQAFGVVSKVVPKEVPLTSFSIVFARAKGDLAAYCAGAEAMKNLRDGDTVLIAEGCTHHRQCNDIGTVKLPRWIEEYTGRKLHFEFCSGNSFPDLQSAFSSSSASRPSIYALVVQCGGCMLTRRTVQARIARCRAAGVPITNYGIAIAACHGIHAEPNTCMVYR